MMPYKFLLNGKFVTVANLKPQGVFTSTFEPIFISPNNFISVIEKFALLEENIGSLVPGMAGDAAVFDLREGRFVWHDMAGHNVEGKVRLDPFLTIKGGRIVWQEGRLSQTGEC